MLNKKKILSAIRLNNKILKFYDLIIRFQNKLKNAKRLRMHHL